MQFRFCSLFLAFSAIMFATISNVRLLAQADDVPNDPTTAMTIESGDPITDTDDPNNQDVPADANYTQPEEPYAPDLPETVSNYEGPVGVTGIFNGNITTGCSYDPLGHSAHRAIDDIVVPGSIGKYPLKMTRYYNSRQQYYALAAIGLSPGWAHEYSWLLWAAGHKVVSPHGNVYDDYCGAPVGVSERWENRADAYNGTWRLADGGKVVFTSGRVTDIYDPYGQRTRIAYDATGQRVKVTEPGGRCLWFTYSAQDQDGTKLLTWVQAYDVDGSPGSPTPPTGHIIDSVNYTYTACDPGVEGRPWKKMLTGVNYSDGRSASYQYRTDNVHEDQTSHKMYPVLQWCDDVRYNAPMRTIRYDYQNAGPHGAIIDEKYPGIGAVSAISPGVPTGGQGTQDTFTETRGDGPDRTFNYTHIYHCQGAECGPCDDQGTNGPNQQMLLNYTDFRGQTTYLGYDANWYINSVRDTNNHTSSYTRGAPPPNGIGEITQITYPGGAHVNYGYESPPQYPQYEPHYITSITNERGKRTTYTRDGNHRVTRIDYPFDQYTPASYETFTYNNFGQVLTHRLKNGAYESFAYSTRGLLTDKWNPKQSGVPSGSDPHTHYDYYTSGWWTDRVKIETLPANTSGATARETYEYDRNAGGATCAGRGLVTKITHADGKYRKFGYTQFGTKAWEENELSQRTNYTYDNYKRLRTAQDPMSHTTSYDYSPAKGNTTQCYLHTTNSPYWVTTPALIVTKNLYDQNFRKTSATVAWNTPSAATTSFGYDNVGNLTRVTDPRNKVTVNGYDARNRKTSTTEASGTAVQETTVWHYDPASNINQIDRPDGTSEIKGFDALNRMMWDKVPYWWTTPPEYHITWFTYNPSGTVQSIRDPKGQTTSFAYNASDEKITMTYPINQTQSWVYDNAHNLASRTTVGGKTQNFMYDNLNRKVGMTWSNGADSATYGYDYASRLTSATNPNSTVTRTYYADGRLEHDYQAVTGLGSTKSANYVYNGDGNVTWMNVTPFDSPSYNWSFTYDAMGRFETIAPYGGSVAFKYAYDNASNVTHRYTYLPGSVTVDQSTPRDSLNRIYGRWIYKNGAPFAAQGYTYDQMNRLTTVTWGSVKDMFGYYWDSELYWAQYVVPVDGPSQVQEGGDPDLDTTGGIDPWANYQPPGTEEPEPAPPPPDAGTDTADTLSQLQSLETPGAQRIVGYGYDKAGNRWATTDNGTATSYYANSLNQYTGVGDTNNVVNGSEHEIQTYQGNTYTYINDEHLKQVTSGTNTYNLYYDALGRCVKRTLGSVTTYYVYDGERPVLEYKSGDLTHPAKNLYGKGIDEILMRTDPTVNSGQPFYYGQDHEGSVTHLINTSGNVIENYQYDAYGAVTKMWTNGTLTDHTGYNNRFLFTGREYGAVYQKTYVPAFTFYEYRARAYHPGLGRFMSEDPKLFDAGDYNLFRYCHNDPLDMTDPMGLDAVPNGDGTYHFVLRSDVVVPNMIGAYVINKSNGTARQCAGAGQFLTGTRLADGTLHDAPPARHSGWTQGAPVTKDTPNGTLVARRWENGVYPNKDIKEYNAEAVKKDPSIINHTGIKVGWENGKAIILDQWRGESGSLQKRSYDPKEGDWSVVNAKKPYDPQPSTSDFNLDQAIKKGIQEAQDAASDVIHTKPHEQRQ